MIADLFAGGPVAVAQLTPYVFSRLGDKRQHRLIALLAFILRVVALAPTHLLSVKRVHGGVGVDGDHFQLHVGRLPDPFPHGPYNDQNLSGDIAMQRVHKSPEGGLHRQLGDFENARQDRVARDEAQLVQPRKADVEAEYNPQHKSVQAHGTRNPVRGYGLLHQGLESEFLQHGDHRQQPAVRSQILTVEVIGRGTIDFIGLRSNVFRPLFDERFFAMLSSVRNHLGDLLGVGFAKRQLRNSLLYPNVYGVPKWFAMLSPSDQTPRRRIAQVKAPDEIDGHLPPVIKSMFAW